MSGVWRSINLKSSFIEHYSAWTWWNSKGFGMFPEFTFNKFQSSSRNSSEFNEFGDSRNKNIFFDYIHNCYKLAKLQYFNDCVFVIQQMLAFVLICQLCYVLLFFVYICSLLSSFVLSACLLLHCYSLQKEFYSFKMAFSFFLFQFFKLMFGWYERMHLSLCFKLQIEVILNMWIKSTTKMEGCVVYLCFVVRREKGEKKRCLQKNE